MGDRFIGVGELIPELIAHSRNGKKVAFCFSGGGARGAYFAGVVEAIQQEVNRIQANIPRHERWVPDFICGTSAGALVGFPYWIECLLPSTPPLYACRQTSVWQDISNGNRTAEKLFTNSSVIDLLSHSSNEVEDLLDSVDALKGHWQALMPQLEEITGSMRGLLRDLSDLDTAKLKDQVANYRQQLRTLSQGLGTVDTSALRDDMQSRAQRIREKADSLKDPPDKLKEVKEYVNNARSLLTDIRHLCGTWAEDVGKISVHEIREFVANARTLAHRVGDVSNAMGEIAVDEIKEFGDNVVRLKNAIGDLLTNVVQIIATLGAIIERVMLTSARILITAVQTKRLAKDHSGMMVPEGLEQAFEAFIADSFPRGTFPPGQIDARKLDEAVLNTVEQARAAGRKVPELFITGTDINAQRAVVFTVAPPETYEKVTDKHLWAIRLDPKVLSTQLWGERVVAGAIPNGEDVLPDLDGDDRYIFGASRVDAESRRPVTISEKAGTPAPAGMLTASGGLGEVSVDGDRGIGAIFQHSIDTTGHSLLIGAVITSATIPLAFPPRQWAFKNERTGVHFVHWFVDGGVATNRPIDVAEKAGADVIVSFELTPLLSMDAEMKKQVLTRPKFTEVFATAMLDTTLNAWFWRYFEDLVQRNIDAAPDHRKPIYRIAPMIYSTPYQAEYAGAAIDDQSIGPFDFNGRYDEERKLRMGLFDWTMVGYFDAHGAKGPDHSDPVVRAYEELAEHFGAVKNARAGRRSAFFDATIQAHPTAESNESFSILSAVYGANESFIEVTHQLRSLVKNSQLNVLVSNAIAGDPISGVVKTLKIKILSRGQAKEYEFGEGQWVTLPA